MANEQNLTHKLTVSEQREGGRKSVEVRRKKKTFQTIISEILQRDVTSAPQIAKLAAQMGLEGDKDIKELYSYVVMLKTLKRANLGDLKLLCELLGEETASANIEQEEQHNDLIQALRTRYENKHAE